MDTHARKRVSKKLSRVLRHDPALIGVRLDAAGWVGIDTLLAALAEHGTRLTRDQLDVIVADNDKQRFAIDGDRIRANQGHSIDVDLRLTAQSPPTVLYHGTAAANVASILATGLHRGRRHHVHLSGDSATARAVGARHGSPVVFTVAAAAMHDDGHGFFRSANGVWLTDAVPATRLRLVRR